MTDYKCLEISFPKIDFEKDHSNSLESTLTLNAHLYTEDDVIELKILAMI